MTPVACLFDFDGVIVDSLSIHLAAWDTASQSLFGETLSDERKNAVIGLSTKEIASIIAKDKGRADLASKLAELKKEELRRHKPNVPLLPGVSEVFRTLTTQKTPFGIASNAPHAFITKICSAANLSVPVVVGIESTQRPKPFPDPFLFCAKQLGIDFTKHSNVLVFEDSRHGLKAAVDAGMIAIGVETQHPRQELLASGARETCKHLLDALQKGWFTDF